MSSAPLRSLVSGKKQGFLLIEALIALSMLCVVALVVGGYFHAILSSQSEGKNRLVALSIARTAMEHLCAGNQALIKPKQEQFKVEWQLTPEARSFYERATVTVMWEQNKQSVRSITLESGVFHEHA